MDAPKGIKVYSEDPTGIRYDRRKIIASINKQFSVDVGSGITDFRSCDDLNQIPTPGSGIDGKSKLAGCGFRIRLKLPGKTDNVVLEQFNLRALVNSEQDGFGNNWDYEQFNSGSAYGNSPTVFQKQGTKGTFAIGSNSFDLQHDYPNFFSLPVLDDDNVASLASFTHAS